MFISITESPIDAKELIERTRNENAGAIVTFQGTVRRFTGELEVESLVYDSYRALSDGNEHIKFARVLEFINTSKIEVEYAPLNLAFSMALCAFNTASTIIALLSSNG